MAEPQEPGEPKPSESAAAPASAPAEPIKAAAEPDLPVVEAPKLDGSEAAAPPVFALASADASEKASAEPSKPAGETVTPPAADERIRASANKTADTAALSRSLRFALLAASVAFAAGLGSFVGSLSASGVARLRPAAAIGAVAEIGTPQAAGKTELAELNALKASLDGATRSANGQFAKLADRLDRVERAQIEPAVKLAHIADAVDRLEKKGQMAAAATPETTATIPSNPPAPADAKPSEKVLQDWIVQDVHGSRVLVASRYGGVFEVVTGAVLPGIGRVEAIKRQDGQWVVVTAHGIITER